MARAPFASMCTAVETDARGKDIRFAYDDRGRLIRRKIGGVGTFEYAYDSHSNLLATKKDGAVSRSYAYDKFGRLTGMSEGNYSKKWTYDGKNVASVAYLVDNSQICRELHTRTRGTLTSVDTGSGANVWRLAGEDEMGRPTTVGLGSLTQHLGYDRAGRVTWRKVGRDGMSAVLNMAYDYDCETGNMTMRTDSIYGHGEAFAYDYLNRLCEAGSDSYAYDTSGNMTHRSGVGDYVYDVARPFAVSQVPFNATIPQREQFISYNALQQPDSIIEGGVTATFTYGADMRRSSMCVTRHGNATTTHYYDGTFNSIERKQGCTTQRKQILYLAGDAYTAPAAMVRDYGSDRWQLRHIFRDTQGSVVAVTDTAGNVLERDSYDPWGVRRDPLTLTPYAPDEAPELLLGRGYGSHEHLGDFGLINMNARLYDPALCRFLSPDPVVQSPYTPQNLNRYAFCLNNPLRYTDPTGMFTKERINGDMYITLYNVEVTAKRLNPFGVNRYIPQNPNEWLDIYMDQLGRQQQKGENLSSLLAYGGNSGSALTAASLINTSVSLPVNIINQHWTRVQKTEAAQIAQMRQAQNTAATQKALQAKQAQNQSLSKATNTIGKLSKALTLFSIASMGYNSVVDIEEGHATKVTARIAVTAAACLSVYIPVVGPFVSAGLGIADAIWGEQFYDWVDENF